MFALKTYLFQIQPYVASQALRLIECGKTYWRQGELLNRKLTTPLGMGDYLAVGDLEGYIHILDKYYDSFYVTVQQ